ncbi:MAG: Gfo/Idh/MocA family oxidoreductase [Planctomycetota bacterium]
MSNADAVKIAVAGLGGYAKTIAKLILEHGSECELPAKFEAACDPDLAAHAEQAELLRSRGVTLYDSYEDMLRHPGLEAVWLPVPIDLHVPFTEQALAAGLAVMLEKPVAGTVDEIDQLIAARDAAGRPLLIGFQDVYDSATLPLKRRLLAGELGKVQNATVHGCWPRHSGYFSRATWAGAIKRGDTWVLDSPANNAMAHFINIVLFLLGNDEPSSAHPTHLAAELYRAAEIKNYDTASIRVDLHRPDPADFLILLTHATSTTRHPIIDIKTERGGIRWTVSDISVSLDGQTTTTPRDDDKRPLMLESFALAVRDQPLRDRVVASLEVARCHTLIINAASQAAPITPIPAKMIKPFDVEDGVIQTVPKLEDIFERCAADRQMLHESGRLPFTVPAQTLDLTGYTHFAGPAES